MNWRMILFNEVMELILESNREGLNHEDRKRLKELWNGLTDYGKEQIQIWSEDQGLELPFMVEA